MALYDTDKVNQDRSVPKPNQSDQLIDGAKKNHGTTSVNYVTDATAQHLIQGIHSGFFTIIQKGTGACPAIPTNSSGANKFLSLTNNNVIPHNLGFAPAILAFIDTGSGFYTLPSISNFAINTNNGGSWITYQISVDTTNVYPETDLLIFNGTDNSPAQNIVYYLLQETST